MISFTVYKLNGEIVKSGNAPESMLEIQVNSGEYLILGAWDDSTYYIDTTNEHTAVRMPNKPSEHHKFDYDSKAWIDPRGLITLKSSQWAKIKERRDEAEFGVFEYNNMIFDGDLNAQRRLATYISISKSNTDFSAMFILADNSVVQLAANDFIAIEVAKATQVAQAFEKAAMLRNLIENSNSKEEIESIVW